ncbi:MAG: hypothetical protein HQL87_14885 [Magnetococcales bacterium]|nr:hypothetical protein [Magnetococcales bacterium]
MENNPAGKLRDKQPFRFLDFHTENPLNGLPDTVQVRYLCHYLKDLGAVAVMEEPSYFDRDFLAQHQEFYCRSATGYSNTCRRLHFFKKRGISRDRLLQALGGDEAVHAALQEDYLGFIVLRPIHSAPLGRTVLAWYEDRQHKSTPRIIKPSRENYVHIAGLRLMVFGLSWQQQDHATGTCATVGLWSVLQAKAYHPPGPTTPDINRGARHRMSYGERTFPFRGLDLYSVMDAIHAQPGMEPFLIESDIPRPSGTDPVGFTHTNFVHLVTALIRGGFPVLLCGQAAGRHHINCVIGFRSCAPDPTNRLQILNCQEEGIRYIYLHDDSIGPNARFQIRNVPCPDIPPVCEYERVELYLDPPEYSSARDAARHPKNDLWHYVFVPQFLIVAVPESLRTTPATLLWSGMDRMSLLAGSYFCLTEAIANISDPQFSFSCQFVRLTDYLGEVLEKTLMDTPEARAKLRTNLAEEMPIMSQYIGLVRIGFRHSDLLEYMPLVDILHDTTDSDQNHPVFATVCFQEIGYKLVCAGKKNASIIIDSLPRKHNVLHNGTILEQRITSLPVHILKEFGKVIRA